MSRPSPKEQTEEEGEEEVLLRKRVGEAVLLTERVGKAVLLTETEKVADGEVTREEKGERVELMDARGMREEGRAEVGREDVEFGEIEGLREGVAEVGNVEVEFGKI